MTAAVFDALIARFNDKEVGMIHYWASRNPAGNLVISWDLTFRRNTCVGAYMDYSSVISTANANLRAVADSNSEIMLSCNPCTQESCQRSDEFSESNGDRAYSEYEQTIGGSVVLKNTDKVKRKRDGRKFSKDIHAALDKKLNGKKRLKAVFTVSRPDDMSQFEVRWEFKFKNKRYGQAITENQAMWDKVNEIMDSITTKYNDHIINIDRKNAAGYRELSRYIYDSEVKNEHKMSGTIKFSEVLPTNKWVIEANNKRKAA